MSSLKTDVKSKDKACLNTTINKDVFEEFKRCSKRDGLPLNTLIETFMKQYIRGDFELRFCSSKIGELELNDD